MSDSDIQFYARWKDCIIEKLIVSHCYKAEHETNPELAINDLISWEVNVALDPAVSEQAQALVDKGRSEQCITPECQMSWKELQNANGRIDKLQSDLGAVTRERDEARESLGAYQIGVKHLHEELDTLTNECIVLRTEVERLRGALEPLVAGLQKTTWSSWQTTAHFYDAYESARDTLQEPTL